MKKTYSLKSMNDVNELESILKPLGISFDSGNQEVHLDTESLRRMMTRNAGRPYALLKENGYLAHITKGEVSRRMKEETAESIAASLGISRRTLFRRLKEARDDDDELL